MESDGRALAHEREWELVKSFKRVPKPFVNVLRSDNVAISDNVENSDKIDTHGLVSGFQMWKQN